MLLLTKVDIVGKEFIETDITVNPGHIVSYYSVKVSDDNNEIFQDVTKIVTINDTFYVIEKYEKLNELFNSIPLEENIRLVKQARLMMVQPNDIHPRR